MVRQLSQPGEEIIAKLTPEKAHLWHMATGLVGEWLEFELALLNMDEENALEESGDMLFYLEGMLMFLPEDMIAGEPDVNPPRNSSEALADTKSVFTDLHDQCKKYIVYGKENLSDLCDTYCFACFYFKQLMKLRGYTMKHIELANMKKLSKRFPGFQYSDKSAIERKDKENGA